MKSKITYILFVVSIFLIHYSKAQTTVSNLSEKKAVIATVIIPNESSQESFIEKVVIPQEKETSGSPVSITQIKKDKEEYIKQKQKDALLKGKADLEKEIELNRSNPVYNLEENIKRLKLIENQILTNYN